uniref:Uncharacterized protein n=1 Tax=Steinernema glaseri TaxID=37863 RepID=A0A1I8ADB4_9BILA
MAGAETTKQAHELMEIGLPKLNTFLLRKQSELASLKGPEMLRKWRSLEMWETLRVWVVVNSVVAVEITHLLLCLQQLF